MGQRFGYQYGDYPITEEVSDRLLRLPLYNSLTVDEQSLVVDSILDFDDRTVTTNMRDKN
jgi:dTDP-4-amino-4,6-dideoxygalactose transaminase